MYPPLFIKAHFHSTSIVTQEVRTVKWIRQFNKNT